VQISLELRDVQKQKGIALIKVVTMVAKIITPSTDVEQKVETNNLRPLGK